MKKVIKYTLAILVSCILFSCSSDEISNVVVPPLTYIQGGTYQLLSVDAFDREGNPLPTDTLNQFFKDIKLFSDSNYFFTFNETTTFRGEPIYEVRAGDSVITHAINVHGRLGLFDLFNNEVWLGKLYGFRIVPTGFELYTYYYTVHRLDEVWNWEMNFWGVAPMPYDEYPINLITATFVNSDNR
ncbi:hypothetical protein [Aureibacter tunicatorum]|uniref:Uncharacterized protein n=1 Tax=Aureibacter tunicatorum TaxID=866807 RepID=A0AAE3XMQ9_9BACT|nr:hypothetical protein [Aureibacter tunicatorum]MDR6239433.1 hypothetical protein [Aureibacter tunicatorum]BDD04644.1 hypothetical protein AUTU_21270 [Aureibacter tunicatorum]